MGYYTLILALPTDQLTCLLIQCKKTKKIKNFASGESFCRVINVIKIFTARTIYHNLASTVVIRKRYYTIKVIWKKETGVCTMLLRSKANHSALSLSQAYPQAPQLSYTMGHRPMVHSFSYNWCFHLGCLQIPENRCYYY